MLRASATQSDSPDGFDLTAILGSDQGDGGLPHGALLTAFVEAAVGRSADQLIASRDALVTATSEELMVDAAAVMANFEMMTRVADSTGARLGTERVDGMAPIREQLGLDAYTSAR